MFGNLVSNAQQPINDAGAQIRIFESVLQHIQNDYVDQPNLEKVRAGAFRGLADGLRSVFIIFDGRTGSGFSS